MTELTWTQYCQVKSDHDFDAIKTLFKSLNSLLRSPSLQIEQKTLGYVSKRIGVRLRSAKVVRLIKHSEKCLDNFFELKLSDVITENLSSIVNENYNQISGQIVLPFRQQIDSVLSSFVKSISILKKFILVSMNAFSSCYQWLRSGNLVPHFLMMSSCLSRLNYISKAIIVYISDLFTHLKSLREILKEKKLNYKEVLEFPESLEDHLKEIGIKCSEKPESSETTNHLSVICGDTEDIGVVVKRNELKEELNKKQTKQKKNKNKKNKNKMNIKSKHEIVFKNKSQKQIKCKNKKRKNKN